MVQLTFFRTKYTKKILVLSPIQNSVFTFGQVICLGNNIVQNYGGKQLPKDYSLKMAFTVAESRGILFAMNWIYLFFIFFYAR